MIKYSLLVFAVALVVVSESFSQTLDDPFSQYQWGLNNLGSSQRIELDLTNTYRVQGRAGRDAGVAQLPAFKAKKKIIVAVLDTGIDIDHPDLKENILWKDSECKALAKYKACLSAANSDADKKACDDKWINLDNPEVDQDHNGYPMDCHGWSILTQEPNRLNIWGKPDFDDNIGHGTHVSGIIAASKHNGIGIEGLSDNVVILPVQVIDEPPKEPIKPLSLGDGSPFDPSETGKDQYRGSLGDFIARGVIYAVNSGAQVVNLSLGWPAGADSDFLRATIKEAQKKGVIFVAAAGNDSTRALLSPCSYDGVICVGAHGPDGSLSYFSNYGTGVDLAAPGTQILSTYPTKIRSIRFLNQAGFEYLHGTSQATPFVTAAVAELLARGVPPADVLPRLIAGARPLDQKLPILAGPANDLQAVTAKDDPGVEKKWILSGALDVAGSVKVTPREVIRPVSKEKQVITWDRQSSSLSVDFALTNIWADVAASSIKLDVKLLAQNSEAIRPQILSTSLQPSGGIWKRNEVRKLHVDLRITDAAPSRSRIPSQLDFVTKITSANATANLVLESEVVVPINEKTIADETFSISGLPQNQITFIGFDEIYDNLFRVDYLVSEMDSGKLLYHLFVPDQNNHYAEKGVLKISMLDDEKYIEASPKLEFATQRLNWKGATYYVLGINIDRSKDSKTSEARFWLLDQDFKVVKKYSVENKRVSLPSRLFWTEIAGELRPVWLGNGFDANKKPSLIDSWEQQQDPEKPKLRIYYYGANDDLKDIDSYQDMDVLDVLDSSVSERMDGSITLLLGKNHGTEEKPAYLVDYSVAQFKNDALNDLQPIAATDRMSHTNLAEGTEDQVVSLDINQTTGTSWAAVNRDRTMAVTSMIDDNGKKTLDISYLLPMRGVVDAVLKDRSVYAGGGRLGTFAFTNSEIQYQDLVSGKTVEKSWERYSFFDQYAFAGLHFPMALADRDGGPGIPALYITESTGFSRGVNIKTVQFGANGAPVEIVVPAKLRFKSDVGCKPMDTPVRTRTGGSALDYRCGDRILRMKLEM